MFRKEVKFSVSTDTFIRFWLVILGFLAVIAAVWWARTPLMLIAMAFFFDLDFEPTGVVYRPFLARQVARFCHADCLYHYRCYGGGVALLSGADFGASAVRLCGVAFIRPTAVAFGLAVSLAGAVSP